MAIHIKNHNQLTGGISIIKYKQHIAPMIGIIEYFLINEKIAPFFNGVGSVTEKATLLEDVSGDTYELSGITFTIDIVY
jgi:hypothetical protein